MSTDMSFKSNFGWQKALAEGFVERAILTGLQRWDSRQLKRPSILSILPPVGVPMGRLGFDEDVLIDPDGIAPTSAIGAYPTYVEGHLKKVRFGSMNTKKAAEYNDTDLVHGFPGGITEKANMVTSYIMKKVDYDSWQNLFGAYQQTTQFNPSGEWNTYRNSVTGGTDFTAWSTTATATPLNDIDDWIADGIIYGAPEDVPIRMYVGPSTFRYLKRSDQIIDIAKYWDEQLISNPNGAAHFTIRGIPIIEVRGRFKHDTDITVPPNRATEGDFSKTTKSNDLNHYYMENPDDNDYEDALMVWGTPGNTYFSKIANTHSGFESGTPMDRSWSEKKRGIFGFSRELQYCSAIRNPFGILHIKKISTSMHYGL